MSLFINGVEAFINIRVGGAWVLHSPWTLPAVTFSADNTWSVAQTGLTLTSPTINGTIATTGLTLPAVTLGGDIAGGASYTIEADTVFQITTANLLQYVSLLKQKLDIADRDGKSSVPDSDRWLIVPPEFETLLVRSSGVVLHVPDVYQELVKRGFITELQGFKVFKSNRLTGDNTNGFRVLAGHPYWCTFAEKVLEATIEEDITANFGSAYKDLFVYGAKITDSRRHFAAEGYWKF